MSIKKIVISPYSRALRNEKRNPKDYPYWEELISLLRDEGFYTIQIGTMGEKRLSVDEVNLNLSLKDLKTLINTCSTWISVDNFLPHLCTIINKPGIVLWGKSDPTLFGYDMHVNLLKDVKYLREKQFDIWEAESYDPDVFVKPEIIINKLNLLLQN